MLGLYVFVKYTFLCNEGEKWNYNWWLDKSSIFEMWGVEVYGMCVYCVGVVLGS